jgi:hypothetical protein
MDSEDKAVHLSRKRPSWIKPFIMLTLVFLSGMVTGGMVVSKVMWGRFLESFEKPEGIPERMAERLGRELRLTDDQRVKVMEIFAASHADIEAARRKAQPEITKVFETVNEKIRALLSPEQIPLWEKHTERMKRMLKEGPPPPDFGGGRPGGHGMGHGGPGPDGPPPPPADGK